jgi:hypothetical protein
MSGYAYIVKEVKLSINQKTLSSGQMQLINGVYSFSSYY